MAQEKYNLILVDYARGLIVSEQAKELPQIDYNFATPYQLMNGQILLLSEGDSKYAILYKDSQSFEEMVHSRYYPVPDELLDHHYRDIEKVKNMEDNINYYIDYLFTRLKIDTSKCFELDDSLCDEITQNIEAMKWEARVNIFLSLSVYLGHLKIRQNEKYQWHCKLLEFSFNPHFLLSLKSENDTILLDYYVDRYLFSNEKIENMKQLMFKIGIQF